MTNPGEYDPYEELRDDIPETPEEKADRERMDREEIEREQWDFWCGVLSQKVGRREIHRLLQDGGAFRMGNACFAQSGVGFPHDRATDYHMGARDFVQKWYEWFLVHHTEMMVLARIENDGAYEAARKAIEGYGAAFL